jgi:tetratricopeptide (TPR) repeat protein
LATLAEGQYVEAQGYFQKSLEIFGEYFEGWDIAISLIYLGDATLMSGDLAEAERIYLKALRLAKETRSTSLMLDALAGLALFNAYSGNSERALELSSVILNHPAAVQETKDRANQIRMEAEARLNAEQIQTLKAGLSDRSLEGLVDAIAVK